MRRIAFLHAGRNGMRWRKVEFGWTRAEPCGGALRPSSICVLAESRRPIDVGRATAGSLQRRTDRIALMHQAQIEVPAAITLIRHAGYIWGNATAIRSLCGDWGKSRMPGRACYIRNGPFIQLVGITGVRLLVLRCPVRGAGPVPAGAPSRSQADRHLPDRPAGGHRSAAGGGQLA